MKRRLPAFVCTALLLTAAALHVRSQSPGAAIFERECASCHTGAAGSRAPAPEVLRQRSPDAILSALTAGAMRVFGAHLSGQERRAVAEFLTGKSLGGDVTGAAIGRCTTSPPFH